MRKTIIPIGVLGMLCAAYPALADVTVVSQGKSTFSIVIPEKSPSSVKAAAQELQKDIRLSTKAEIPIKKESEFASGNLISLGATKQAQQASIFAEDIDVEGFRITTKGGNIYIIGPDTADGSHTKNGGASNGTANGVYTFLEDYLGVRWLGLGDKWTDIPNKSTFAVEEIDRKEAPYFIYREQGWMQNSNPAVAAWSDKQKLGYSFGLYASHSWMSTVTPSMYKQHPEWFAMDKNGKRLNPNDSSRPHFAKLETTNQEMVEYFAKKTIERIKKNPERTASLSPSDGGGWSQSPESKEYYDPKPPLRSSPSVTPLILKFYHDVANIVHKELPEGRLAGYIYSDYLYPPQKGDMVLPDNFYPQIAPSIDYGYELYRPEVQKDFQDLLEGWSKVTPHLFFYDLPNRIRQNAGMVTPAAPEILNFMFPHLIANNIKGVNIYGNYSWSESAMNNYIRAKMIWDPKSDAYEIQREWLQRAYGDEAGEKMEKFYRALDQRWGDYVRSRNNTGYNLTRSMLTDIYAEHYQEYEDLYLEATRAKMTDIQRQRLQEIGNNLAILQWRLKDANLLPASANPKLPASDDVIDGIFAESEETPAGYYGMIPETLDLPALKTFSTQHVKLSKTISKESKTSVLPYKNVFLIYAAKDGTIRITPRYVDHKTWVGTYVLRGADAKNSLVKTGVLIQDKQIEIQAKAGQYYYLSLSPHRYAAAYDYGIPYTIQVDGAAVAKSTFDKSKKTLSIQDSGNSVYLYGDAAHLFDSEGGAAISTVPSAQMVKYQLQGEDAVGEIFANLEKSNNAKNLLKNGDFSSTKKNKAPAKDANDDWENAGAPANWSTWKQGSPEAVFAQDNNLNRSSESGGSARMAGFSTAGTFIQSIDIEPGKVYAIRAWMRQQGAGTGFVKARWKTTDGKWGSTGFDVPIYPPVDAPKDDWQKLEGLFVAPPKAAKLVLLLEAVDQPTPQDVLWYDDVAIYEVP